MLLFDILQILEVLVFIVRSGQTVRNLAGHDFGGAASALAGGGLVGIVGAIVRAVQGPVVVAVHLFTDSFGDRGQVFVFRRGRADVFEQFGDLAVALARSAADAPEIDGRVYVNGADHANPGDLLRVRITQADAHDLLGDHIGD